MALIWGSHEYFPTVMEVSRMAARIRKPYLADLIDEQWAILQPKMITALGNGAEF